MLRRAMRLEPRRQLRSAPRPDEAWHARPVEAHVETETEMKEHPDRDTGNRDQGADSRGTNQAARTACHGYFAAKQ
jgi:hypothetical protein